MPKPLDSKLIEAIERAYLTRKDRPSIAVLAKEFGVSQTSIKTLCRKRGWARRRDEQSIDMGIGAKAAAAVLNAPAPKVNDLDVLNQAIAMMLGSATATEPKSQEGCVNALNSLIKTKRELFPLDIEAIADLAIAQGFGPAEFLEALRRRWDAQNQQNALTTQPVKPGGAN